MKIQSHKELRVWQEAMDSAMEIFEVTKRFPPEERFSLVDQVRRASRSVATNIAEAWRKRRYQAAFVSKLNDSETEATETQTWIEFARRCRYVTDEKAAAMDERYEKVIAQLVTMINNPKSWIITTRRQGD